MSENFLDIAANNISEQPLWLTSELAKDAGYWQLLRITTNRSNNLSVLGFLNCNRNKFELTAKPFSSGRHINDRTATLDFHSFLHVPTWDKGIKFEGKMW